MTQLGEGVSLPEVDKPEEKEEEVKSVKIRYSVFFDGTLNNKTNINSRLLSVDESKLTAEEKKTAKDLKATLSTQEQNRARGTYKKNIGVDSFENGYTNIVKLERHIKTQPYGGNDICLASYIEGPGTRDEKKDDTPGYALGISIPFLTHSGIKRKVKNGVSDVVAKINKNHNIKDEIIEQLTLDVFGFSRGAAGARYFIYKALLDGASVKKQLTDNGYKVKKVEFKFVGLFDTVSSHGFSFSNDTPALKLDSVAFAKQVVHLAAADEHREKFSLTDIRSAKGNKGIQVYLPGVHSDIGGSYRDNKPDGIEDGEKKLNVFWDIGSNSKDNALKEKERLIKSGWYTDNEIEVVESRHTRQGGGSHHRRIHEANIYAGRAKVSNQYSRIPLQIMADFAAENDIEFKPKLKADEKISSKLSEVEQTLRNYLKTHKNCENKKEFTSKPDDWLDNKRTWLNDLRHDYFHFSAHYSIGLAPRIENGVRVRQVLKG